MDAAKTKACLEAKKEGGPLGRCERRCRMRPTPAWGCGVQGKGYVKA